MITPLLRRCLPVIACIALCACGKDARELRVGIAMPLSGELGEEGKNLVHAAELAAEQIRASGLGPVAGKVDVTIVPADDKGEDAFAPAAAQALASQRVSAVIGHLTSGSSIAAAPVYAQQGIVQLSMATHPHYTQLGFNTTFRLFANDAVQAQALGRYCASQFKGQGFAVIDDGSVYGKNLADATAEELRGAQQRVAHRRTYDPAATAFPELMAVLAAPQAPTVVVTTMEATQAAALVRALVAAGRHDVSVVGGDTLKTAPVPKEAAQLRGYLTTTPVTDVREFGANGSEFVRLYTKRFGQPPVDAAHYVYDAVFLIAQAAALEHSTDPAVLGKVLRRVDPTLPITGSIRFRDDGELRFAAISLYAADKGIWRLVTRGTEW